MLIPMDGGDRKMADHKHRSKHGVHDHSHHHHEHDHDYSGHIGHNHSHANDHLHSHTHGNAELERAEELKALSAAFVEGFRNAQDKTSYLRLAQIPFQRKGSDGLKMFLVDANIVSNWQIGTASPAFASPELAYMHYPGKMVSERETMTFIYVSKTQREDIDLGELLKLNIGGEAD